MMLQASPRRSDSRPAPARAATRTSAITRWTTSGATALLFALGPLGAGLAMADEHSVAGPLSAPGAASKELYVDRVDRICAAASSRINDVLDLVFPGAIHGDLPPQERDAWAVEHVAPIIRTEIHAARLVTPPAGDAQATRAIFDAKERALEIVERNPAAFRHYGQGTFEDPFAKPAQLAGDYGLSICALGSPDVD
jgi:hypothetical protein